MRTNAALAAPPCPIETLTGAAFDDLIDALTRYGNKLDPSTPGGRRHREALRAVLHTYSHLAITREPGRVAYPLAVGVGKTQSIASWCAAVHRLDLDLSILVCQEKVNSLEELYRDLLKKGIPAERIGILHSKPHDPQRAHRDETYASLPSCDLRDVSSYQYLLVTHAKIKTRKDIDRLNAYGGEERSLCIWDESLLKNEGRWVLASEIEHGLSAGVNTMRGLFADPEAKQNATAWNALKYIEECISKLAKVIRERADYGKDREPVRLPERDAEVIEGYERSLRQIMSGGKIARQMVEQIAAFLQISQEPIRMVQLGAGQSGDGAITYLPRVPDALQRIVVLDASYLVRELGKLDKTLRCVPDYEHVKQFDAVTVEQVREYGGRNTVRKLRSNSRLTRLVVEDVLAVPKNEAVLVITYKSKGRRGPIQTLKDALEDAGVDLDQTIYAQLWNAQKRCMEIVEKPRYVFLHWGQEKAVSRYSYCQNMIAVGVLRRDLLDLSSSIVAQTEDHRSELADDREFLAKVSASEQFYRLQQFIGRGSAREMLNGHAKPSRIKVYDQTDFAPFIEAGLPGSTWEVKERRIRRRKPTKRNKLKAEIVEALSKIDSESISVQKLKERLGARVSKQTFQAARAAALKELPEWTLRGRSFARK